jgi:hypothetical protein
MNKKHGGAKNVFIDMSRMVFECQVPIFTHDAYGNPIVAMWDCENKKEVVISEKEYRRRRSLGEL